METFMIILAVITALAIFYGICYLVGLVYGMAELHKETKEKRKIVAVLNTPENKRTQEVLRNAKMLAEQEGLISNYNKNCQWLEFASLQFKDDEKLINASIVYYVYGIHDLLVKRYCFRTGYNENILSFMAVVTRMQGGERYLAYEEFAKEYQFTAVSLITEFDHNKMEPQKYKNFIVDLCDAKDDKQFLKKIQEYGAEIPERMRALLDNDLDTLMETLFYSIAVTVEQSEANYVKWNKYTQLNFIIHYYSVLLVGIVAVDNENVLEHFENNFKKHFVYYAKQKGISEADAKGFFEERAKIYNDVNIMDEDGASELVDITKAYIIKSMGIMYDINKEFELTSQVNMLHLAISEQAKPYFEKIALAYEEKLLDDEDYNEDDDEEIRIIPTQMYDKLNLVSQFDDMAVKIAQEKNLVNNYQKYHKMMVSHFGMLVENHCKITEESKVALINYYIYGVVDKITEKYCRENSNEGYSRKFEIEYESLALSVVMGFPPMDESIEKYVSMVLEIFDCKTKDDVFDVAEKYNREVPEDYFC